MRIRWIDDTDWMAAQEELAAIRSDTEGWDWYKWDPDGFQSPDEALRELRRQLGTTPVFSEGKVIYIRGIPSQHAALADCLDEQANGVMLIIMARPDKRISLYKKATKAKDSKIDSTLDLDGEAAATEWLLRRLDKMGIQIDGQAAHELVATVGVRPSRLLMEAKKLHCLAKGGPIMPWMVSFAHAGAEKDLSRLSDLLGRRDVRGAQRLMARVLASGEHPLRICAFMSEWLRRLVIADMCGRDANVAQKAVVDLKKRADPDAQELKAVEKLQDDMFLASSGADLAKKIEKLEAARTKAKGEQVPMFAKPGSLYYACKTLGEMQMPRGRPMALYRRVGEIEIMAKTGRDAGNALLRLIGEFL